MLTHILSNTIKKPRKGSANTANEIAIALVVCGYFGGMVVLWFMGF